MTATDRTIPSGSPLTRMPPAVGGRAPATASANSASITGEESSPTRPAAYGPMVVRGRWEVSPSASASTVETPGSATSAFVWATYSAMSETTRCRDGGALGARRRDGVDAPEQQRMVRHEQVGVPVARLLDDGERRVEREGDATHRLVEVASDEADPVPVGRAGRRIEGLQGGDDAASTGAGARSWAAGSGLHVGPAGLEPTTPAV